MQTHTHIARAHARCGCGPCWRVAAMEYAAAWAACLPPTAPASQQGCSARLKRSCYLHQPAHGPCVAAPVARYRGGHWAIGQAHTRAPGSTAGTDPWQPMRPRRCSNTSITHNVLRPAAAAAAAAGASKDTCCILRALATPAVPAPREGAPAAVRFLCALDGTLQSVCPLKSQRPPS